MKLKAAKLAALRNQSQVTLAAHVWSLDVEQAVGIAGDDLTAPESQFVLFGVMQEDDGEAGLPFLELAESLKDQAEAGGIFVRARHGAVEGVEGDDVGLEFFRVYAAFEVVEHCGLGVDQIRHLPADAQMALEGWRVVELLPCLGAA